MHDETCDICFEPESKHPGIYTDTHAARLEFCLRILSGKVQRLEEMFAAAFDEWPPEQDTR